MIDVIFRSSYRNPRKTGIDAVADQWPFKLGKRDHHLKQRLARRTGLVLKSVMGRQEGKSR